MAGKVLNMKVYSPLKIRSGLTGNYHAICHYSYNLPLDYIQNVTKQASMLQGCYPTKKQNPNQELAASNHLQILKPIFCYVKI